MSRRVDIPCAICSTRVLVPLTVALDRGVIWCTRCEKRGGAPKGAHLCGVCNKPGHHRTKCSALPKDCLCRRTWPSKNYGCPHHGSARASVA